MCIYSKNSLAQSTKILSTISYWSLPWIEFSIALLLGSLKLKQRYIYWKMYRNRRFVADLTHQISGLGIHSFAHCSNQMSDGFRVAQIAQNKWATVSKSLRSLKSNEWPWANRSGRPWQMSDHERFAQVAHDKWANERFALKNLANKIWNLVF